jgi:glutaminyl-peptide cyclotransferase
VKRPLRGLLGLLALSILGGCWLPLPGAPFPVPLPTAAATPAPTATPTAAATPAPTATQSGVAPVSDQFTIVNTTPHDRGAWTEGLTFSGGQLYESTGQLGQSSLRRVDLPTGTVLQRVDLSPSDYGEGVAFADGLAWVLTWKQQHVLRFDPTTFAPEGQLPYTGEGWGLTTDGTDLYMSNGSSQINVRDPATFDVLRTITVTDGGQPVEQLNELEWIDGQIWANVWLTPFIVVIDPGTGHVLQRFDFTRLIALEKTEGTPSEMNGIAWLPEERRLFVTGKYWGNLYEIHVDGL